MTDNTDLLCRLRNWYMHGRQSLLILEAAAALEKAEARVRELEATKNEVS